MSDKDFLEVVGSTAFWIAVIGYFFGMYAWAGVRKLRRDMKQIREEIADQQAVIAKLERTRAP